MEWRNNCNTMDGNKRMYCAFEDLEKAYDRIPRNAVYLLLMKTGVMEKTVRMVLEMHREASTVVRAKSGEAEESEAEVGVHQASVLCPFLLVAAMHSQR